MLLTLCISCVCIVKWEKWIWNILFVYRLAIIGHDTILPFGSRLSPYILTILQMPWLGFLLTYLMYIPYILHYWDNFFLADNNKKLSTYMDNKKEAFNKLEGPTTYITYLGIQINSSNITISLPPDKLTSLQSESMEWSHHHWCRNNIAWWSHLIVSWNDVSLIIQ